MAQRHGNCVPENLVYYEIMKHDNIKLEFFQIRDTFPSNTVILAAGEDSVVDVEGNMWKLASRGDRTISF